MIIYPIFQCKASVILSNNSLNGSVVRCNSAFLRNFMGGKRQVAC